MNDTQRPVLILIHGASGNHVMWDPVRRALDPSIEVVAPDLPGHGCRRDEPFTLAEAVRTVAAEAARFTDRPLFVGGDSLGGFTSLASAQALPAAQLRGLILSGCTMNFEGSAMWPYWLRIALFRTLLALYNEEALIQRRMPAALRKLGMPEEDIAPVMAGGLSMRVFEQCVHQLRGIDWRARLAAVTQPVLLLNGAKDRDMMRDEPGFFAAARQGQRHVFPDAGHGVSVLRSPQFAALVNAFVAEHAGR